MAVRTEIQSTGRITQSLFPSCWSLLQQFGADRYVFDRETVISAGEIFSFGDLLELIHRCMGDDFCLTAEDR